MTGALAWCFKVKKFASFAHDEVFRSNLFLAFSYIFFINDFPASLRSSVGCSFYAENLAIWSSSSSDPAAVEATQGALIRRERWCDYLCFPLNPNKCETSFFLVDATKLTSIPIFSYSTPSSALIPTEFFLESPSSVLFLFLNLYLC